MTPCPRCGQPLVADASFCHGCGATQDPRVSDSPDPPVHLNSSPQLDQAHSPDNQAGQPFVGRSREMGKLMAELEAVLRGSCLDYL